MVVPRARSSVLSLCPSINQARPRPPVRFRAESYLTYHVSLPLLANMVCSAHWPKLNTCVLQTAIMAAADMFTCLRDEMLPHMDMGGPEQPGGSLLAQLLLKVRALGVKLRACVFVPVYKRNHLHSCFSSHVSVFWG